MFLKSSLAAGLMLGVTCCSAPTQTKPPEFLAAGHSATDAVADLESKSVAIVRKFDLDDEDDALAAKRTGTNVRAFCTGVWVSQKMVLTARHCTRDADLGESFLVATKGDVIDPTTYAPRATVTPRPAKLAAVDEDHDMALLKVADPGNHEIGEVASSLPRAGDYAQSMGQSLGLWWSYSSGYVAAIRNIDTGHIHCFLVQTTTPISPGNSGGALFNAEGEIIGVAHAAMKKGENLNFFVHPTHIKTFLKQNAM